SDIRQRVEVANVHGGEPPYLCSLDAASYSDEFQFWFTNYMRGDHIYRVMDSNECVTEKTVFYKGVRVPLIIPAFFTPDGKGENETWVIKNLWFYSRSTVEIFDRYGKRVASYSAEENSWDGTYNGHQMPSDDYWYVIRIAETGEKISGHFILRR
ncbi:MAG: T9SS type B sorting domain-containing protein, partial [Paludibacteraceae bacterium]|nr:T9SS type B sorting domain-containing protein [Paludibacteraceae bacterium]